MAKDRARDPKRVPSLGISDPISNVRTLPGMQEIPTLKGGISVATHGIKEKGLGDISVDMNPQRPASIEGGPKKAVAYSFPTGHRATGSGETLSEARQKAYNAVSTKKAEGAKSGETARQSAAKIEADNQGKPKKVVKIKSNG